MSLHLIFDQAAACVIFSSFFLYKRLLQISALRCWAIDLFAIRSYPGLDCLLAPKDIKLGSSCIPRHLYRLPLITASQEEPSDVMLNYTQSASRDYFGSLRVTVPEDLKLYFWSMRAMVRIRKALSYYCLVRNPPYGDVRPK